MAHFRWVEKLAGQGGARWRVIVDRLSWMGQRVKQQE
jgi:hypothetical protein